MLTQILRNNALTDLVFYPVTKQVNSVRNHLQDDLKPRGSLYQPGTAGPIAFNLQTISKRLYDFKVAQLFDATALFSLHRRWNRFIADS